MTDTKDTGLQSLKIQTITTSELLESIKRQMEFYFSNEFLLEIIEHLIILKTQNMGIHQV